MRAGCNLHLVAHVILGWDRAAVYPIDIPLALDALRGSARGGGAWVGHSVHWVNGSYAIGRREAGAPLGRTTLVCLAFLVGPQPVNMALLPASVALSVPSPQRSILPQRACYPNQGAGKGYSPCRRHSRGFQPKKNGAPGVRGAVRLRYWNCELAFFVCAFFCIYIAGVGEAKRRP
jgi:hypothetical protein